MTETMTTGAIIVLKAQVRVKEKGGGLAHALTVYSPDLTPLFTGTGITVSQHQSCGDEGSPKAMCYIHVGSTFLLQKLILTFPIHNIIISTLSF